MEVAEVQAAGGVVLRGEAAAAGAGTGPATSLDVERLSSNLQQRLKVLQQRLAAADQMAGGSSPPSAAAGGGGAALQASPAAAGGGTAQALAAAASAAGLTAEGLSVSQRLKVLQARKSTARAVESWSSDAAAKPATCRALAGSRAPFPAATAEASQEAAAAESATALALPEQTPATAGNTSGTAMPPVPAAGTAVAEAARTAAAVSAAAAMSPEAAAVAAGALAPADLNERLRVLQGRSKVRAEPAANAPAAVNLHYAPVEVIERLKVLGKRRDRSVLPGKGLAGGTAAAAGGGGGGGGLERAAAASVAEGVIAAKVASGIEHMCPEVFVEQLRLLLQQEQQHEEQQQQQVQGQGYEVSNREDEGKDYWGDGTVTEPQLCTLREGMDGLEGMMEKSGVEGLGRGERDGADEDGEDDWGDGAVAAPWNGDEGQGVEACNREHEHEGGWAGCGKGLVNQEKAKEEEHEVEEDYWGDGTATVAWGGVEGGGLGCTGEFKDWQGEEEGEVHEEELKDYWGEGTAVEAVSETMLNVEAAAAVDVHSAPQHIAERWKLLECRSVPARVAPTAAGGAEGKGEAVLKPLAAAAAGEEEPGVSCQQHQEQQHRGEQEVSCAEEDEDYWGDGSAAAPLGDGEECWRLGGDMRWKEGAWVGAAVAPFRGSFSLAAAPLGDADAGGGAMAGLAAALTATSSAAAAAAASFAAGDMASACDFEKKEAKLLRSDSAASCCCGRGCVERHGGSGACEGDGDWEGCREGGEECSANGDEGGQGSGRDVNGEEEGGKLSGQQEKEQQQQGWQQQEDKEQEGGTEEYEDHAQQEKQGRAPGQAQHIPAEQNLQQQGEVGQQGEEEDREEEEEEQQQQQSSVQAAAASIENSLDAGNYAEALQQARTAVQAVPSGKEVPLVLQQLTALASVLHYSQSRTWREVLQLGQPQGQTVGQGAQAVAIVDVKVLRQRYRKLASLIHPDKCSCPAAEAGFKALSRAYQEGVGELQGNGGEVGGDEEEEEGDSGYGGMSSGDWWSPWVGEGGAAGAAGGGGGGRTVPGAGDEEPELWHIPMQVRCSVRFLIGGCVIRLHYWEAPASVAP